MRVSQHFATPSLIKPISHFDLAVLSHEREFGSFFGSFNQSFYRSRLPMTDKGRF
jgi:hypothetical protein